MRMFRVYSHWFIAGVVGLILCCLILNFWFRVPPVQAFLATSATWQDTGVSYTTADFSKNATSDHPQPYQCLDSLQPGRLLTSVSGEPASSINLFSGLKTRLNNLPFTSCNQVTGLLYAGESTGSDVKKVFSSMDPAGKVITHFPTQMARDGSLWVYTLEGGNQPAIFASSDGGVSWQKSNTGSFQGKLWDLQVANSNGRVLYALTQTSQEATTSFFLYASTDAGNSWEKRLEQSYTGADAATTPTLHFLEIPGRTTPANYVEMVREAGEGRNGSGTGMISTDGGRTFVDVLHPKGYFDQVIYSDNSFVRLRQGGTARKELELANSSDGGKTWQPLALPFSPDPGTLGSSFLELNQVPNAPSNLFIGSKDGSGDLWRSADGGKTWQVAGQNMPNLLVSPYAPTFLLSFDNDKIYRLDLPQIDNTQTRKVQASGAPDDTFFGATSHNLSGIFKNYWIDHGGMAQFGQPWTEPFREYNPADGKIYLVQYFERNRFEYHPELAGTSYEVLLGLLGNQQTAARRVAGEGPFNSVEKASYPQSIYFSETGHNLGGSFKTYWEANGGLALYGYPISEEFEEVNPDDGQTYVVQYFERTRFEYHPENKGTHSEVLLGLLGNTLLKSKGWL